MTHDRGATSDTGAWAVRPATPGDIPGLAVLRAALWPEGPVEEHAAELPAWLADPRACSFVAVAEGGLVGFVEGQLRSHADGCATSPVGYLEGWYVAPGWRRRGVGAALVAAFEAWARAHGCRELASDTWLDNLPSQVAHHRLGFEEVDRVITYRKALEAGIALTAQVRPPLHPGDPAPGTGAPSTAAAAAGIPDPEATP